MATSTSTTPSGRNTVWARKPRPRTRPARGSPATSTGTALAAFSIEAMQARSVIFWQCNNALKGVTVHLAAKMKMPPDVVRAELITGLLPGVTLVPAHTMAIGISQEHGCTYESIG